MFNGEIFGYRKLAAELRDAGIPLRDKSDTEVLFQLIRREGVRRALDRIDGQFAFAFRDGASGTVQLVRDPSARSQLYYAQAGNELVFASEVSALLVTPPWPEPGWTLAAYQFLTFEYLPGTASGSRAGIAKLEPGCILTHADGHISIERYWIPQPGPVRERSEAAAAERLDALLAQSVRDRVVADVPVGVFLSGGIDSASVLAARHSATAPGPAGFTHRHGQPPSTDPRRGHGAARHAPWRWPRRPRRGPCAHPTSAPTGRATGRLSLLPTWLVEPLRRPPLMRRSRATAPTSCSPAIPISSCSVLRPRSRLLAALSLATCWRGRWPRCRPAMAT